jgi:hypothetical protein
MSTCGKEEVDLKVPRAVLPPGPGPGRAGGQVVAAPARNVHPRGRLQLRGHRGHPLV